MELAFTILFIQLITNIIPYDPVTDMAAAIILGNDKMVMIKLLEVIILYMILMEVSVIVLSSLQMLFNALI